MKAEEITKKRDLREFYENAPGCFFAFSHDGFITYINQTFLDLLGYSSAEIIAVKKFNDILTVGSRIFFQTHFYPLIKLHGKFNEIFLSFLSKTGEELPLLLNVKLEGNGEEFEVSCSGLQIAQRNRFEKELLETKRAAEKALLENEALTHYKHQLETNLENLEKRLQTLAFKNEEYQQITTVISHDLQEPLRKVSLFYDRMVSSMGHTLNDSLLSDLRNIDTATKKMRALVLSLQEYLSLNGKQISKEYVNLKTVIQQAQDKLAIKDSVSELKITVGDMPSLNGDQLLLVNLFFQLLDNSLKFRDKSKPELQINILADIVEHNIFKHLDYKYTYKEFIRITYTDNGSGFPTEFTKEIFSIFRKAHNTDGMGIGLAYCKKITELHEGFISASSVKGEGTSFVMHFPNFS